MLMHGCQSTRNLRKQQRAPSEDIQAQASDSQTSLSKRNLMSEPELSAVSVLQYDIEQLRTSQSSIQASVESLEQKISQLMEQTQQQLIKTESLESKLRKTEEQVSVVQQNAHQKSVQALLSRVRPLINSNRFGEVVSLLKPIINRVSPDDEGHDELLYLFAKSLNETKAYNEAVVVAAEVETYHAQSSWIPKAIMIQGDGLKKSGKKKEAHLFYQDLIKRFPKSAEAKKAKQYIK
jgi:hypothetical protein